MKTILLTGAAGFIGSHVALALAARGDSVIGVDNFNSYYDPQLKRDRAARLQPPCRILEADISDIEKLKDIFSAHRIDVVCHLAAQAGVGYSLKNPFAYETANNLGTLNLLELCRHAGVSSFIYASSSSVYGGNTKIPFRESDPVDYPISIYAATKRYNELLARTYSHLYGIRTTGLRFFTVYGPWGRPDMALFKFTKAILADQAIDLYNHGKMRRDFTYIDDIVSGVVASIDKNHPCEVFNLGNNHPVDLGVFVEIIEKHLGKKAHRNNLGLQPGDVPETYADISKAQLMLGYQPSTDIDSGIKKFLAWYREYFKK